MRRPRRKSGAQHSEETNASPAHEADDIRDAMGGGDTDGGTLPPTPTLGDPQQRIVKVNTITFRAIRMPITWAEVQRWVEYMNSYTADGSTAPTNGIYFVPEASARITNLVAADTRRQQALPSEADWTKWPYTTLATYLQEKFPADRERQEAPLGAYMEANPPPLNSDDKSDERRYALIAEFETRSRDMDPDAVQKLVTECVKNMRKNSQAESAAYRTAMLKGCSEEPPEDFAMLNAIITANRDDFLDIKKDIRNEYGCDLVSLGPRVGKYPVRADNRDPGGGKSARDNSEASGNGGGGKKEKEPFVPTKGETCEACGNKGHKPESCAFVVGEHPDVNKGYARTKWSDSEKGKRWLEEKKLSALNGGETLAGRKFDFVAALNKAREQMKKKKQRTGNTPLSCCAANHPHTDAQGHTLQCGVKGAKPTDILITDVLIDTGALQANYIDASAVPWLSSHGVVISTSDETCKVCGVAGCTTTNSYVVLNLDMPNKHNKQTFSIPIKAWILKDCPYDIIVGRPDIEKHKLLDRVELSGNAYSTYCMKKRPRVGADLLTLSHHKRPRESEEKNSDAEILICTECRENNPTKICTAGCAADKKNNSSASDFASDSGYTQWAEIESVLPIEVYVSICDELYAVAQKKIMGIKEENLKSPDNPLVFRFPDTGSGTAGRRVVTQTCMLASVQGHDNNASATQLHELYTAPQRSEGSHGASSPIKFHVDGKTPKIRAHAQG